MLNSTDGKPSRAVIRQAESAELPTCRRIEEIAIALARMPRRRRLRAAAQHHLIDHELAIVLAERTGGRAVARIGRVGAACPLPDDAEGVRDQAGAGRDLPL